jgi:cobalt-zinc-cadmium efflux system outer membrane protein
MRQALAAVLAAVLWIPCSAAGQERSLSLSEALETARARAATILAAAGRVEEARARLLPASRLRREGPVLEAGGGRRQAGATYADYEIQISQAFEPAARRQARLAGAEAAVETARAELEDTRRVYLGEVAAAFVRALAAAERLRLTERTDGIAADLLAAEERRFAMGESTALEINRARTAAARARAEQRAAEGESWGESGQLGALLGLADEAPPTPAGRLRDVPSLDLPPLLAQLPERPDLRALDAAVREAEAEVRLGEALRRPDFGARTGYAREEGADIVSLGVAVSLPFAGRGEEERAAGAVRAASLRAQREAAQRTAEAELRGAFERYRRRVEAVAELERTALPAIDDNEALARRSFEAGEIDLGELLLIQREILETRLTHLDLMLDARLAAVELETKAGGLR